MTPNYHSPLSPVPIELNEDQNQQLFSLKSQSSSSSSSVSCPIFFNTAQEQEGCYHKESQQLQHQEEVIASHGGLCDHPMIRNENGSGLKFSIYKKEDRNENQSEYSSVKWMSSKMRLMKKMMNTDHANIPSNSMPKFQIHKQLSSSLETDNGSSTSYNNNNNNTIRVCADCNTTKTPLWRSGPRGPKSLCNACGIRQRKARRAMAAAAAAAAANGTVLEVNKPSMKSKLQQKEKKSSNGCVPHFKKRCKLTSQPRGRKKLCFEDLMIILSKNSAYQRVFPQDEKEAAILLMALSYGHVYG